MGCDVIYIEYGSTPNRDTAASYPSVCEWFTFTVTSSLRYSSAFEFIELLSHVLGSE
jgi:hypothetical protein